MTDEAQTVEFQVAEGHQVNPADWAASAAQVRESIAADGLPESAMAEVMNGFRFLDDSGASWMYDGGQWLRWGGQAWAAQPPPAALRLQPFTLDWLPDPTRTPPFGIEPLEAADAVAPDTAQPVSPAPAAAAVPSVPAAAAAAVPGVPAAAAAPSVPAAAAAAVPAGVPGVPAGTAAPSVPAAAPVPVPVPVPAVTPQPPPYRPTHRVPPSGMPAWSNPDPATAPQFRLDPWLDVMVVEAVPSGWARVRASNGWTGWVDGRLLISG